MQERPVVQNRSARGWCVEGVRAIYINGRSVKMQERALVKWSVQGTVERRGKELAADSSCTWERAISSKDAASFKITTSSVLPFHERKFEWSEIITWAVHREICLRRKWSSRSVEINRVGSENSASGHNLNHKLSFFGCNILYFKSVSPNFMKNMW